MRIVIKFMLVMKVVMIFLIWVTIDSYAGIVTPVNDDLPYDTSFIPESRFFTEYEDLAAPDDVAVIYPILTQSAYAVGGIHDFYAGYCDDCLTAPIEEFYDPIYAVGGNSFKILEFLGYDVIDDITVDQDPYVLRKYKTIILLHNEFVTASEFHAIKSHPNVIYLYPGALSSKVEIDYKNNEMVLLKGPGYPSKDISNGFNWKYDNSEDFDKIDCDDWAFKKIEHGFMLNCNPEYIALYSVKLFHLVKTIALL